MEANSNSTPPDIHGGMHTGDAALWQGVLAVFIGASCFGTMHVPVRIYITRAGGDGFFIQWVMSIAIVSVGAAINYWQETPPVYPLAMLGGMCWTIANSLSQYVISGLGLAVALLLWNSTNCLTGWTSGRFGLFGLEKTIPENETLNLTGLVLLLIGGFSFALVKKTMKGDKSLASSVSTYTPEGSLLIPIPTPEPTNKTKLDDEDSIAEYWKKYSQRILCVSLALLSGFFYGATAIPVIYMEDHPELYPKSSRSALPYVFSHYLGVFTGSSTIFSIYMLIRRNTKIINTSIIVPSFIGGLIWALGMVMLFVSNDILTQTITYPVMTTVPGCVASLWSIFLFKEINSRRNYSILLFAFVLIFIGAVLVFLSKIDFS